MTCVTPGTITQEYVAGVTKAVVTMTHCDGAGFMYLSVEFTPKNIGASIEVQGAIVIVGENGPNHSTGKVIFNDDGSVTNYGDVTHGVRFRQAKHNMKRPHKAILSCSFK
jgi:hypothetical protein